MPVYKQTAQYFEDGFGPVKDVIVIADTYEALDEIATAIEVNVLRPESTKHDLDVEAGVFVSDEIGFGGDEVLVRNANDLACLNFILQAQDPANARFIARYINPTLPVPLPDEAEFRGRIRSEQSARDLEWSGAEFSSTIEPTREWKFSAGSFEIEAIVDKPMKDLVRGPVVPGSNPETRSGGIDGAWVSTNAPDRLGYYYHAPGHSDDAGNREARFAKLVGLGVVIQELLNRSVPAGITATFVNSDLDLFGYPARFATYDTVEEKTGNPRTGARLRYLSAFHNAYSVRTDDFYQLKTHSSTGQGGLFVSWLAVNPKDGDEAHSWLRYESLAEALYNIAAALGMFIEFNYVTATNIEVRLMPRSVLVSGVTILKDMSDAELDVAPVEVGEERKIWRGDAWKLNREGPSEYQYDGAFLTRYDYHRPENKGESLPITIGVPICQINHDGATDLGVGVSAHEWRIGERDGWAYLPHNAVMWNDGSRLALGNNGVQNLENLHTGLYVKSLGLADNVAYEEGVGGLDTYLPVASVMVKNDVTGESKRFDKLADFANWIQGRDNELYYAAEYKITVPYLCSFRATVGGPLHWRNCKLGSTCTLDGLDYVIVGIERAFGKPETKLRLQAKSRMTFGAFVPGIDDEVPFPPPVPPIQNDGPVTAQQRRFVGEQFIEAGEPIVAYNVLRIEADGKVYNARAHHDDYGKIYGIATRNAPEPGQMCGLVRSGSKITVNDAWLALSPLAAGARLYLRTAGFLGADPARNIGHTPLAATTATEDFYCEVGVTESANTFAVEFGQQFVFHPPLP